MNIIEPDPHFYIYTTPIMLLLSMSSIALVVKSISSDDLPITSMKLFFIYFLIGIVGFFLQGISFVADITANLDVSIAIYMICSFILIIAIAERWRTKWVTFILGIVHIILMVSCILLSNNYQQIAFISIYALVVYSFIGFISFYGAYKGKNVGFGIIGFAAACVSVSSVVQIYILLYLQDVNLTYYIVSTTSAVGFLLVGIGFLSSILIIEHKQLANTALSDPLTGLLNRRGMDFSLNVTIRSAIRHNRCISVIVVDIDSFKNINDTYGHDAGDKVIVNIAGILKQSARASDVCCRFGGEEFVLILTDTAVKSAVVVAERIRESVERLQIDIESHHINITASFGISGACESIDIDSLIKDADKALYNAKSTGRNRVCVFNQ